MLGPPLLIKTSYNIRTVLSERPDQMLGAWDTGKAARSWLLSAHGVLCALKGKALYFTSHSPGPPLRSFQVSGHSTGNKAGKGRPAAPSLASPQQGLWFDFLIQQQGLGADVKQADLGPQRKMGLLTTRAVRKAGGQAPPLQRERMGEVCRGWRPGPWDRLLLP